MHGSDNHNTALFALRVSDRTYHSTVCAVLAWFSGITLDHVWVTVATLGTYAWLVHVHGLMDRAEKSIADRFK